MRLYERELRIAAPGDPQGQLGQIARSVGEQLGDDESPVRFVVSSTEPGGGDLHC